MDFDWNVGFFAVVYLGSQRSDETVQRFGLLSCGGEETGWLFCSWESCS